jgi:hypothetical protein
MTPAFAIVRSFAIAATRTIFGLDFAGFGVVKQRP